MVHEAVFAQIQGCLCVCCENLTCVQLYNTCMGAVLV